MEAKHKYCLQPSDDGRLRLGFRLHFLFLVVSWCSGWWLFAGFRLFCARAVNAQ